MAFKRVVIAVVVFVIFVGGAFTAYYVADYGAASAAQTPETVENESIVQHVDLWQFVNRATDEHTAGFNESVTVYNSSDAELEKGVDYQWNASDGSITYENTASVDDGETGTITYVYFENTQGVKILDGPLGGIVDGIGMMGVLAGGMGLIVLLLAIAAFLAKVFSSGPPRSNR